MVTPRFATRWQAPCGAINDKGGAGPYSFRERAPVIRGARLGGIVTAVADIGAVAPQKPVKQEDRASLPVGEDLEKSEGLDPA